MKNLVYILILFLFPITIWGQVEDVNRVLSSDLQTARDILTLNNNNSSRTNTSTTNGSTVMIQQVGSLNQSFVAVSSSDAFISVNQFGNKNNVALSLKGEGINESITQIGYNNNAVDRTQSLSDRSGFQLLQQGRNLYFERQGINNISKDIKVRMRGDSRSILIRNFR